MCWGHPGIAMWVKILPSSYLARDMCTYMRVLTSLCLFPSPINMLDTSAFRIIYTLIFGIMSSTVLSAVLEGPKVFWEEPKNNILKKLVDGELAIMMALKQLDQQLLACSIS